LAQILYTRSLAFTYSNLPNFKLLNLKHGYDGRRATWPLLGCFAALCVVLVLAIGNWQTVFDRHEVRFQSWLGLARSTYPYSAVKDIRTAGQFRAPNGDVVQRREWIIEFADGARWKTSLNISQLTDAAKADIAKFVSEQSGKPIRELNLLE
jgi:hypothetical protein